jgi:hypothetical protein
MMTINGIHFDPQQLMTKDELLSFLRDNGGDDHALGIIRERNIGTFGNELIWPYRISDGKHHGTFIAVVQDGFLSIPYNEIDKDGFEKFELQNAAMFDEDAMSVFIDDWKLVSDDLVSAMGDMLGIIRGK